MCTESTNMAEEKRMLNALRQWLSHTDMFGLEEKISDESDVDLSHLLTSGHFHRIVLNHHEFLKTMLNANELVSKDDFSAFQFLSLAVSLLQCFVAINYAGKPVLELNLDEKKCDEFVNKVLVEIVDGESVLAAAMQPVLLAAAIKLFDAKDLAREAENNEDFNWILAWWHLRALRVHQSILSEASEAVYQHQLRLISAFSDDFLNNESSIQLHLELSHLYRTSLELQSSENHCNKALDLAGLELSTTGVMGRRTRFQQRDLAQLTIDVVRKGENSDKNTKRESKETLMPIDVKLNDEVRLERIQFANDSLPTIDLSPSEQSVALTLLQLSERLQPRDNLTREQLMPYIDLVLSATSKNWAICMNVLLIRSLVENKESRTVERSLLQLEHLVDSLRGHSKSSLDPNRLLYIYSSGLKPYWQIEIELVRLQMALGSNKAALDTALRLQLWDEVVSLYHQLRLRHKAAEIIRQQLNKPDLRASKKALLLCMLGDATDNIDCYYEALEISKQKSARALRSLGYYFYFKKEYEKSVEYMQKSLELNSCQLKLLLRLGFAAMEIENWRVAADAYRKYCAYEADNFEAWNNLSNAYVHLGDKWRAWRVLQEALKCDYDNWKIWANVMAISIDCSHYEEALRAYHRLLDLKPRHLDPEILLILVTSMENDLLDHLNRSCREQYLQKTLKLLGRLTAEVTNDDLLWQLYARLISLEEKCDNVKLCQYWQRAVALMSRKEGLEASEEDKREKRVQQVMETCSHYVQAVIALHSENVEQSRPFLASARLSLRSLLVKIRRLPWLDESEELLQQCDQLDASVAEMQKLESAL